MDLKKLEKEALSLPAEGRAALAQRLLLSLDDMSAHELNEAWLLARIIHESLIPPSPAPSPIEGEGHVF